MLTITLDEQVLQESIDKAITTLISNDNYNNPLKGLVEKAVGSTYSRGTLTDIIEAKIIAKINQFIDTTEFDILLGQAVAKAIADREIAKKK